MRITTQRSFGAAAFAALSLLAVALSLPAEARAQWTQPDANNNITNTNTGNVGVGTSAPQSSLHVSTSSTSTGSRGITNEQTSNDANGALLIVRKSRAGGAVLNGDNIGNLYASAFDGTSFVSGSRIRFFVDGTVSTGVMPTGMMFVTGTDNSAVERMRITSGGNIGIGTGAPGFRFEVSGSASRNTMALTGDGDTVGYAGLKIQALTTTNIATNRTSAFNLHMRKDAWYGGDGSGPSFIIETNSKVGGFAAPFLITPNNNVILNGGQGASGLSYGNVGVGTTSPAAKFSVSDATAWQAGNIGAVYVNASNTVGAGLNLHSTGTGGRNFLLISTANGASPGSGAFGIFDATLGTEAGYRFVVNSAGNVGIGTLVPSQKLDVAGNVNGAGLCIAGDCKTAWSQVGGTSQWTTSGSNVYFNTGNVGVGTTSPVSPLEVSKSQAAVTAFQVTNSNASAGNGAAVRMFTSGNNALTLSAQENAGAGGYAAINQEANLPLLLKTSNTERLRITGAGNVGVGTANPEQKLDVRGNLILDAGASPNLYTGAGAAELGRYLNVLNSPGHSSASGLKAGGVLVSDDYGYANPAKTDLVVKGRVGIGTAGAAAYKLDVAGSANASGLCIAGDCKTAWSQVGGGTSSQWTTSGSSVHYNTGNVGVGTDSPNQRLGVQGMVGLYPQAWALPNTRGMFMFHGGGSGSIYAYNYPAGTPDPIAISASTLDFNTYTGGTAVQRLFIANDGNIGVGTSAPSRSLEISKSTAGNFDGLFLYNIAGAPHNSSDSVSVSLGRSPTHVMAQIRASNKVTGTYGDGYLAFSTRRAEVVAERVRIDQDGNVGIGTAVPGAKLHVEGAAYVNGNVTATGNISAKYQDVAEWVPTTQKLRAGTVVVLDRDRSNHVLASTSSYDMGVAGVISEQPGVILGEGGADKVMVATTGRVRVKVDATRGAIRIGDLLVTGDEPGVAMKSEPVALGGRKMHAPGTIIGKALEPLASGKGEILVLLSLQ